jgi:hypothetical protein
MIRFSTFDSFKIYDFDIITNKNLLGRKTHVRSQKPPEVVQEIYGWLLGHWSVRVLMFQAATTAGVPPLRLSLTGTLRVKRPCYLFLSSKTYSQKNFPFFRLVNCRDFRYIVT